MPCSVDGLLPALVSAHATAGSGHGWCQTADEVRHAREIRAFPQDARPLRAPPAGTALCGLSAARAARAGDVKEFGFRELPAGEGAGAHGAAQGPKHKQEHKHKQHHLAQLKPVPLAVDGEADPRLALTICVCGAHPCNNPSAWSPRRPPQGRSHREAGRAACVQRAWRARAASMHGRGRARIS